jgi:hypothetical protein
MSFSSYFSKKYKYQTQAELKNLDAEQIANILPNDVNANIRDNTGGVSLTTPQQRAMFFLLQLKKSAKLQPSEEFRKNEIAKFLRRERTNSSDVDALIAKTTRELDDENTQKLNKLIPNAPSNTPMPWPTAPTTPVNRGGKSKKTKSRSKKTKSRSKKTKSRCKKTKSRSKKTKSRCKM